MQVISDFSYIYSQIWYKFACKICLSAKIVVSLLCKSTLGYFHKNSPLAEAIFLHQTFFDSAGAIGVEQELEVVNLPEELTPHIRVANEHAVAGEVRQLDAVVDVRT